MPLLTLPPEILTQIFTHALTPSPSTFPYPTTTFYTRPATTTPLTIPSLPLLLTCRHIYHLSAHLPRLLSPVREWHLNDTGPPDQSLYSLARRGGKVGPREEVVLFCQMRWLQDEHGFAAACAGWLKDSGVKRLRVVVRWSDWWGWEQNRVEALRERCFENLHKLGLEEFTLELEVVGREEGRLGKMVEVCEKWRFGRLGCVKVEEGEWYGPGVVMEGWERCRWNFKRGCWGDAGSNYGWDGDVGDNSELGEETQSEDADSEGYVAEGEDVGGAEETGSGSTENRLRFVVRTLIFRPMKE